MAKENPSGGLAHNALEAETTITGNIEPPKDIRIDGKLVGNINCSGKVIIGQMGSVTGNIVSTNVEIMGTVIGNLDVAETLTLKSTSFFEGDICTQLLIIEPKATLNGKCTMNNQNQSL